MIALAATFEADGTVYHDDPALGPAEGRTARTALMGDIVHLPSGDVRLEVDIHAAEPIGNRPGAPV